MAESKIESKQVMVEVTFFEVIIKDKSNSNFGNRRALDAAFLHSLLKLRFWLL
jgi:hypothetical protein